MIDQLTFKNIRKKTEVPTALYKVLGYSAEKMNCKA